MNPLRALADVYLPIARQLNWAIITTVTLLGLLGVASLYAVAGGDFEPWAWRHGARLLVGLALMLFIASLDLRVIFNGAYLLFGALIVLLIGVEVFGVRIMGAQRWLDLSFIRLQPSELVRLGLILALARYYQRIHQNDVSHPVNLIVPLAFIAFPALLILRQPDLGTAAMLVITGLGVLFLTGISWRYFLVGGLGTLAAIPLVWQRLLPYQKERVLVFLDPERDPLGGGYHIIQSKIGIGSGGLFGKGFAEGTQSRLNFLPEKHTDFIFTMFAEEMGFIGSVFLMLLFVVLLVLLVRVAGNVRNQFSRLVVSGIGVSLFFYMAVNLAMVMGLAPVVGVPLPFISYGGTSLVTILMSIGVVLSLDRQAMVEMNELSRR